MRDDSGKREIEQVKGVIDRGLFARIDGSHGSPFSEGDLWSGLRTCHKHGRGPTLFFIRPTNAEQQKSELL